METGPQRPPGQEDAVSALNNALKNSNIATVRAIFRSATNLLTMTRVRLSLFRNDQLQAHNRLGLDSYD